MPSGQRHFKALSKNLESVLEAPEAAKEEKVPVLVDKAKEAASNNKFVRNTETELPFIEKTLS